MTAPRRLVIVGDVGGEEPRHVGDEAMLEANFDGFRRSIPDVEFTVVSRDPGWVAARYGVGAVPLFGFPSDPSAGDVRTEMLERILSCASSRERHDATIEAVASCDAVVVSGGGNLSSTWPDLLHERAALLHLAKSFGKPAVVLGQTIGPRLDSDDRRLLAASLASVRLAGVRDIPSAVLALGLCVAPERVWYQCDDAIFLEHAGPIAAGRSARGQHGGVSIAVTIDPQVRATGEALFDSLARQLREIAGLTGARLVLVPHAFGREESGVPSDLTEARMLAERIGPGVEVVAGLTAREAKGLAEEAAMVISTRHHPIVFALGAGVPSLGIHGDDYCRIKLQGALAHARLERWTLSYSGVEGGALLVRALELWRDRDEVRRQIESHRQRWREESRERWEAIVRSLDPAQATSPPVRPAIFGRPRDEVMPALLAAVACSTEAAENQREAFEKLSARHDELIARSLRMEHQLRWRSALVRVLSPLRSVLRRFGLWKR